MDFDVTGVPFRRAKHNVMDNNVTFRRLQKLVRGKLNSRLIESIPKNIYEIPDGHTIDSSRCHRTIQSKYNSPCRSEMQLPDSSVTGHTEMLCRNRPCIDGAGEQQFNVLIIDKIS